MILKPSDIKPQTRRTRYSQVTKKIERNLEERIHGHIETVAFPIVDSIRTGDLSFYKDEVKCMALLHFLTTQYYRTNTMRQRMEATLKALPISNIEITWNVLAHIYATNLAANLHATRSGIVPLILQPDEAGLLITGDQPIINVHRTAHEDLAVRPEYLDLYYPLGPKQALVLHDKAGGSDFSQRLLTADMATELNSRIAANAFSQLYGSSEEVLRKYNARGLVHSGRFPSHSS